jgi:glycosyltransferase involved in cell wall biosynthesis
MNLTESPAMEVPTANGGKTLGGPVSELAITLLTGGIDPHYATGLSMALTGRGVQLELIASTEMETPELRGAPALKFLNLHGDTRGRKSRMGKLFFHLGFYRRLMRYAATAKPKVFHILWNYKLQWFDRTLLLVYYKALGKKLVFTAHNINAAERDGTESLLNRLSLTFQYRFVDHIFVHTEKMKEELVTRFGVTGERVSIIPFGIYECVPSTELTPAEAKQKLGLDGSEKVVLFFGRILPYKGLDYLVEAFQELAQRDPSYRLIIAGEPKKESTQYFREIQQKIERAGLGQRVIRKIGFIANDEIELYFKAADALILPYTLIFQSGVLFMAYSFGLPVIASDVGSFREDIVEGETGFVCRPSDAPDLARTMETYFQSSLFAALDSRRAEIAATARVRNSWDAVSATTCAVYSQLLAPGNLREHGKHDSAG